MTAQPIFCGNTDDHPPRPAVVRISWPGGRFAPSTACASCLRIILDGIRGAEPDHDHPVLVSPLKPPEVTGYSVRERIARALGAMGGCDSADTAGVVVKALGMEDINA